MCVACASEICSCSAAQFRECPTPMGDWLPPVREKHCRQSSVKHRMCLSMQF